VQCLLDYPRRSLQVSKESEQIRISGVSLIRRHSAAWKFVTTLLVLEVLSRTDNRDGPVLIFVSHYGRSDTVAAHRQTRVFQSHALPPARGRRRTLSSTWIDDLLQWTEKNKYLEVERLTEDSERRRKETQQHSY